MTATATIPLHTGKRRRLSVGISVAFGMLALALLMVLFPQIAPHDPDFIDASAILQGPSAAHLLGTDQLGRDVLSRVIAGARTAVLAPLGLATGTILVAILLGLAAGYSKGWVDGVLGRIIDVLYAVPALLVAIVVVGVTGGGFVMALGILLVFGLPSPFRLFRAAGQERVNLPYMEAARAVGLSHPRIIFTQLLPTLRPLLVSLLFLQFTYGLIEVSSLSFLGLGVPPGSADWGRMMFENRATISSNVWATAAPGIALVALAVSTNVIGDWMYNRHEMKERQR
jgi:ABC-type dipeptide/oligopeptide/nickel transport system permease subunit